MMMTRAIVPAWLLFSMFAVGCGSNGSRSDAEKQAARLGEATADRETWDILFMEGTRVGYLRTTSRPKKIDGRTVLLREGEMQMAVLRFSEPAEMASRFKTLETTDGRLISFEEQPLENTARKTVGRVADGELVIETLSGDKKSRRTIAWPDEAGGFFAADDSLRRQPMLPGERRTVRYLEAALDTLVTEELVAADYGPTRLQSGSHELLRIDCELRRDDGSTMQSTRWTDRTGEVLKSETPSMRLTLYRATKEEATAENSDRYDVGLKSIVPVAQPFADPRSSRRAVYRVELRDGDPAAAFVSGLTQHVRSTGPHAAEVTVSSIDPRAAGESGAASEVKPTADDTEPNGLIQSDDPAIVAMAQQAAEKAAGPAEVAIALEQYVDRHVSDKNFATAVASASEVARSRAGDCTEHAVLLAALARASGIPARVAIGLVYSAKEKGFAYHMWNEVYLDDRWVPLDATLGEGRVSADHLKLADSDLRDASGLAPFMPVQKVLGQIKIDLVEAE
jgi:hypothetical protein